MGSALRLFLAVAISTHVGRAQARAVFLENAATQFDQMVSEVGYPYA
jgi:hypothetical protein